MTAEQFKKSFAHLSLDELKKQREICIKNNDLNWVHVLAQMILDKEKES